MVNILTVKFGDKYCSDNVNNLFNSIKKFYKKDFRFFCLTDNTANLNRDITSILRKEEFKCAFNKVSLMKEGFADIGPNDRVVVMDIDIDVVSDPSSIFECSLDSNEIGMFHKWWQYPYKGSWIWGGVYVGEHKTFYPFYERLKYNPDMFYTKYTKLNKYKFKEDLPVRGEQDFILDSSTILNYMFKIFPSFNAETIQPEIEFNSMYSKTSFNRLKAKFSNNEKINTYITRKNESKASKIIFKHYSGSQQEYLKHKNGLAS